MFSLVKRLMGKKPYSSTSHVKTLDPCSVCPQPCHLHEPIPSSILAKIDQCKPLYPTVKEHVAHLFVLAPPAVLPAKDWPAELVLDSAPAHDDHGHDDIVQSLQRYITLLKKHVELAKAASQSKVLLTLAESNELIESMAHNSTQPWTHDRDPSFHLLLFPQRILFPKITLSDLQLQADATSSFLTPFLAPPLAPQPSAAAKEATHIQLSPTRPFIFVCSHMSRDKRCGVLGPPILDAIESWSQQQPSVQENESTRPSVHACSHIGGHKFAGNLIIYPNGDWYGRVTPCHIPDLLQRHLIQRTIVDNLYRGSIASTDAQIEF